MNGFWPETGAGWVALIASLATLVLVPVGYGKWLEKMNGLGRRMKKIEDEHERVQGTDTERRREIDRILGEHTDLIRLVGEAKKSAEHCREDSDNHAILIGSKVDEVHKAMGKMELTVSQRLTAVETELRISRGGTTP